MLRDHEPQAPEDAGTTALRREVLQVLGAGGTTEMADRVVAWLEAGSPGLAVVGITGSTGDPFAPAETGKSR